MKKRLTPHLHKLLTLARTEWPITVLSLIAFIICFMNYTPGTFLSGWDALHPEFDFLLNFRNLLFGVFRPEQGLGAVAAHAHMADLPRVVILFVLHAVFPLSFLRYAYIFLTLFAGPIGMYVFLKHTIFKHMTLSKSLVMTSSFLGGLFYMLNLGTMQQYIVPFEMFNVLYAAMPWLFLFAIEYLTIPARRKQSLLLFCFVTLLATPMAYAAVLWHIFFGIFVLTILLLCLLTQKTHGKALFKRAGILIGLTLLINSFWLLPDMYFLFTHSKDVTNAYTNELFSPEAFLYNKEFGTAKDTLLMKSFLFDWSVYGGHDFFDELAHPWIKHLENPLVPTAGYVFAGISMLGLLYAIKRKHPILIALLPCAVITLFFILNTNPPLGPLYSAIEKAFPIFREALRFPHSKVYLELMFIYALCFAFGNYVLLLAVNKYLPKVHEYKKYAYVGIVSLLLIFFMWPAFTGNFISPFMRIQIPKEYFSYYTWMKTQPDNRVASLPIHSLWGWVYYNWPEVPTPSFQGAGFLWFGMKQPLLDRDFDRWSPYNEEYYREMSYAVYKQDPQLLKAVISKHNIGYIVYDKSVAAPQAEQEVLFHKEIEKLMTDKSLIQSKKTFGKHLVVYIVKQSLTRPALSVLERPYAVTPGSHIGYIDAAYVDHGPYVNATEKVNLPTISYPYRNLMTNESTLIPSTVSLSQLGVLLKQKVPLLSTVNQTAYTDREASIRTDLIITKRGGSMTLAFYPKLPIQNGAQTASPIITQAAVPAGITNLILSINGSYSIRLSALTDGTPYALPETTLSTTKDNAITLYTDQSKNQTPSDFTNLVYSLRPCDQLQKGQVFGMSLTPNHDGLTLSGSSTPLCLTIPLSNFYPVTKKADTISLFSTKFVYEATHPDPTIASNVCIADIDNGNCINYVSRTLSGATQAETGLVTSDFEIHEADINKLGVRVFMDTTKTTDLNSSITFSQFTFGSTAPLAQLSVSTDAIAAAIGQTTIAQNQPLLIPFSGLQNLSTDVTTLPKTSGQCVENPFSLNQKVVRRVIQDKNTSYIHYASVDQGECDHFSYQNLSQNQGYLIFITARNVTGLPLSVCVTNSYSKRCDVYARLSTNKTFTTDTLLLPPMGNHDNGYDININNLGIHGSPASNDLQSIQLVPFPYNWLTSISDGALPPVSSTLLPLQAAMHPMRQYIASGSLPAGVTAQQSILVSDTTYEPGWMAYTTSSPLARIFPPLFGTRLTNHVIVNDWQNGWVLPTESTKGVTQVQVIFLPQYLETFGFLFLLGSGIVLLRSYRNTRQ